MILCYNFKMWLIIFDIYQTQYNPCLHFQNQLYITKYSFQLPASRLLTRVRFSDMVPPRFQQHNLQCKCIAVYQATQSLIYSNNYFILSLQTGWAPLSSSLSGLKEAQNHLDIVSLEYPVIDTGCWQNSQLELLARRLVCVLTIQWLGPKGNNPKKEPMEAMGNLMT